MQTRNIPNKDAGGRYAFGGNFVKGTRINVSGYYADNSAIVDATDKVNIKITGHGFATGDEVVITASTNYNGTWSVTYVDANHIQIVTAYIAETPAANTVIIKGQGHITLDGDASTLRLMPETNCRLLWDTTSNTDITETGSSRDAVWLRAQQPWEEKLPKGKYSGPAVQSSADTLYCHIKAESRTNAAKYVDVVQQ